MYESYVNTYAEQYRSFVKGKIIHTHFFRDRDLYEVRDFSLLRMNIVN